MALDAFMSEQNAETNETQNNYSSRGPGNSVNDAAFQGEPSRDEAYIAGVVMGDGSVYKTSDGRKLIKLQVADKEFATMFGRAFCSLTDLQWSGFEHDGTQMTCCSYNGKKGNHADTYQVSKGIAPIYDELMEYQEPDPDSVISRFESYKPWLLRGLWDSEGSVDYESNRIWFSNTEESIRDIYLELLDAVVGVKTESNDITIKEDMKGRESTVGIPARYSKKFLFNVNPTIVRKRYRLEKRVSSAAFNEDT